MRPIDADAAKKDFGEHFGDVQDAVCAQQIIDRQPTIDRDSLIPHGWWEGITTTAYIGMDEDGEPKYTERRFFVHKKCGRRSAIKENYCPNCGAKMVEEVLNA